MIKFKLPLTKLLGAELDPLPPTGGSLSPTLLKYL
jgi:hypothetical protein